MLLSLLDSASPAADGEPARKHSLLSGRDGYQAFGPPPTTVGQSPQTSVTVRRTVPDEKTRRAGDRGRVRSHLGSARIAMSIAEGHGNREIAEILHVSRRTVEWHVRSVLTKLGVRSRAQLVRHLAADGPRDERPILADGPPVQKTRRA